MRNRRRSVPVGVVAALVAVGLVGCTAGASPGLTSPSPSSPASPSALWSPSPSAPPSSPSAAPSVPPSAAMPSWVEVGSLERVPQGYALAIVGYEGGYVALVDGAPSDPPTVRVSSDGRDWRTIRLPAPEPIDPPGADTSYDPAATPVALATDGTTVVVVGSYYHEPCDWSRLGDTGGGPACPSSPISWASTDGTTWTSSLPWVGPGGFPGGLSAQGSAFTSVWAVPDGWEAGLFYVGGEAGQQREIWHSSHGLAWEHRADLVSTDAPLIPVVDSAGRRLLAGEEQVCAGDGNCYPSVRLWTSDEGVTWAAAVLPEAAAWVDDGVGPRSSGEPWVLAGGGSPTSLRIWTSDDLRTWEAAQLAGVEADVVVSDIAHTGAGYVVVASGSASGAALGSTWFSDDGRTWRAIEDASLVQALAEGPAGVIGLGNADDDGVMHTYQLR